MSLILYTVWGVGIISSQVFGHLGSFKGDLVSPVEDPLVSKWCNATFLKICSYEENKRIYIYIVYFHFWVNFLRVLNKKNLQYHYFSIIITFSIILFLNDFNTYIEPLMNIY